MAKVSRFLSKRPATAKELLEKAADHLAKIGACFDTNLEDLPAEVQRDRNCFHSDKDLFSLLDRHLRHNTLDVFLQKHEQCRELVAFVFGGRYLRLIPDPRVRQALAAADGTSSVDGQKFLSKKRPRQRQHADEDETPWKAKRIRTEEDGGGGSGLPLTERERCALLAFEDFQTADDDPLMPPSARGHFLTRAELDALETKLNGVHSSTRLTFTLPPRSPSPDQSPVSDMVPHDHASDAPEEDRMPAAQTSLAAEAAVDMGRLMAYKGHLLEPPSSLLAKLKSHLSKPDVEQSPRWASCSADIQEYLAHLLQIRAGESWEAQLDEVVEMFRAHTLFDDFHRSHPGLDHSLWDDVMKPRHTLRSPLAPPGQPQAAAAAAAAVAEFVVTEKRAEQEEGEEEEDDNDFYDKDPITFDSMMLAEVPPEDARDPFAYTRWHNRLRTNVQEAAAEAREVAVQRMQNLEAKRAGCPVMNVPRNCSGPVSAGMLLDSVVSKMSSDWTTLRHLRASLQRAARRSPRRLLEDINTSVELGMAFEKSNAAARGRRDGGSSSAVHGRFVRLQKEELDWLSFLGQPSLNDLSAARAMEALCRGDWKLAMLRKRLQKMQRSIAPGSFGDGQRFGLSDFLALVNQDCDGPVKGHRFTMEELKSRIPQLNRLKVLHTEHVDGVQHMRCFPGDTHPEEAVRWPSSSGRRRRFRIQQSREEQEDDDDHRTSPVLHVNYHPEKDDCWPSDSNRRRRFRLGGDEDEDEDDDDCDTSPTTAHVPHIMPNMDDVRTVEECLVEKDDIRDDAARTVVFFRRIAYRLGRTLQEVAAESRHHLRLAGDPARQAANASSLRTLMARWAADTDRSAVPRCRDGRAVASYRDVVLAAEPDALAGQEGGSDGEVETRCRDLVRRRILREAAENKTMLWPLPVPRDSSSAQGGRDGRTVLRREAVWSFAHSSRRESVPRFFDVNTWPLEVQSGETQTAIRARGEEDADAMLLD